MTPIRSRSTARKIAATWHGGMSCPLYLFAKHDSVDKAAMLNAIDECQSEAVADDRDEDAQECDALKQFIQTLH